MFRGKRYKQKGGLMVNPMSPFSCNQYVCRNEQKMKNDPRFARIWRRYADDVFTVVKIDNLSETIEYDNSFDSNIQFTCERRAMECCRFLICWFTALRINNLNSMSIEKRSAPYDILTATRHSHKHAAFKSMIHRMISLLLNKASFNPEYAFIVRAADQNGYDESTIQFLLKKNKRNRRVFIVCAWKKSAHAYLYILATTTFCNSWTVSAKNIKLNLCVAADIGSSKSLLLSSEDPVECMEASGIYQATCSHADYNAEYIGQTKRALKIRSAEHFSNMKKKLPNMSALSEHALSHKHHITTDNFELLEHTHKKSRLDKTEAVKDDGPLLNSILFNCLH